MADATTTAPVVTEEPLLEMKGVSVFFPIEKGVLKRVVGHVRAVDEVSLTIPPGQDPGSGGESGSSKTTLGHAILRAVDPTAGGDPLPCGRRVGRHRLAHTQGDA